MGGVSEAPGDDGEQLALLRSSPRATAGRPRARRGAGRRSRRGCRPPSCRSPGSPSTWRWRTSTGRSTTWSRPSSPRPRSPGCGSGSGSPAALVDGFVARAGGRHRRTRAGWRSSSGSSRPSRCSRPRCSRLARAVADRYAGTLADVLRLAVPPRHARVEQAEPHSGSPTTRRRPGPSRAVGPATTPAQRCSTRSPPARAVRAVWSALPGPGWPARGRRAWSAPPLAAGRGALVVVPDHRDVAGSTARSPACSAPTGTSC